MTCEALIFYDSINDRYRNNHNYDQIQEELSLINKFSESFEYFHSYIRSKKVGRPSVDKKKSIKMAIDSVLFVEFIVIVKVGGVHVIHLFCSYSYYKASSFCWKSTMESKIRRFCSYSGHWWASVVCRIMSTCIISRWKLSICRHVS